MGQKARLPLPAVINPPERLCVVIEIPDEISHRAAFWGVLWELAKAYSWENDAAHQAVSVASVWRDIYFEAQESEGCVFIRNVRINGCVLEYTIDGSTWIPVGNFDDCYVELAPSSNSDNLLMATNDSSALIMRAWNGSMSNHLQRWQNASGTDVTWIDKNAQLNTATAFISTIRRVPGSAPFFSASLGGAHFRFAGSTGVGVTLRVEGDNSVTLDIQQWALSNQTILSAVDRLGRFRNAVTSGAPVDTPTIKGAQAVDVSAEKFYIHMNTGWKEMGATGPAGADGADGADGIDGTNGADGADGIDGTDGIAYNDPDTTPSVGETVTYKMFCRADEFVVLPCNLTVGMAVVVTAASGWWSDEEFDLGDPFLRGFCWNGCEYEVGCDTPVSGFISDPIPSANHMQLCFGYNAEAPAFTAITSVDLNTVMLVSDDLRESAPVGFFFPNTAALDGNKGGVKFTVEVTGYSPEYCFPVAGAGFVNFVSFNRYYAFSGDTPNATILGVDYFTISICIDKLAPFEGECETCYEWSYDTASGYTPPEADISWFSLIGCGGQSNVNGQTDPFTAGEGLCTYCMTIYSLTEFEFYFDLTECTP